MPKTKKPKPKPKYHTSRSWAVPLLVILLLIIIAMIVVLLVKPFDKQAVSTTDIPQAITTINQPTNLDQTDDKDNISAAEPVPEEKVQQYEGENPNQLNGLTGNIAYKNVEQGTLSVSAIINQYLHQPGSCTLILTGQNGERRTVSGTAKADATTSVCETLELPVTGLDSGEYQIEVQISGDGKTGSIKERVKL